jgi:hypothetical protein
VSATGILKQCYLVSVAAVVSSVFAGDPVFDVRIKIRAIESGRINPVKSGLERVNLAGVIILFTAVIFE